MQRVLMIGMTPPQEGGSERHIFEISSRMNSCEVLTQRGSSCAKKKELPVISQPIFLRNISFLVSVFMYSFWLLVKPRTEYDVIHIHENVLYPLIPFLKLRYRVITTVHGIKGFKFHDNKILWSIFKVPLRFADCLIAVNKEDLADLKKDFARVEYVPNGVDLKHYRTQKPSRTVMFIGRIHEQKGIVYLLRAFSEVEKKLVNVTLEIIGEVNEYARQLQKEFPSKNIHWLGYKNDRKEIADRLCRSYCIALPSLWEGLPLTLFEALASGRPVIVSDIPAFKSVLKDEALFFKGKDAGDLAKKIVSVFENHSKAKSLGEKGKKLAQEYSWDSITRQTERVYSKV